MKTRTGSAERSASFCASAALIAIALGLSAWTNSAKAAVNPAPKAGTASADVADLMGKAQTALRQGHPEVALIYLKNAETVAPDVADIHLQLGRVLLVTNNAPEAQRELKIAQQKGIPASRIQPLIYQTMIAQHQGQMLLDTYQAPGPNDRSPLASDTLRARAMAQLQIGKRDDAIASLERALSISRGAQNLLARAQVALEVGDASLAGKLVDEILSKEPNNAAALTLKIGILQRSNQSARALDSANTLIKVSHGAPLALLTRAGIYLQAHQDEKAEADVDAALSAAPTLASAVFYKAVIRSRAKDNKGAWALAQTLPRSFLVSRPDVGMAASQMAILAGQKETGADILHSIVESFPSNMDARIRLAALYLALKELANAQRTLEPVKNSADPRANALMGQVYAAEKNYQQSFDYYQKASQEGFGGENLKLQLASADIRAGKYDDAIHILQPLSEKQPDHPELASPLIAAYLRKGDVNNALQVAQKLASAAPNSPLGPFYEAQVAAQKADADTAITAASTAIKRDGKFAPALFIRADMLAGKGNTAAAESDLQTIVSSNPHYTIAAIRLADLLEQSGNELRALSILKGAAAANPKDLLVYSRLERFYAARKRWPEASATLATFLHNVPNNGTALGLQAELQLQTGAIDAAIKSFTSLLKSYPHSQDVSILLARAYSQKGDKAAAHETLVKAIADQPKAPAAHIALVGNDLEQNNTAAALEDAAAFVRDAPGPSAAQTMASVLAKEDHLGEAQRVLEQSLSLSPDPRTAIQLSLLLRANGKAKAADGVLEAWLTRHPNDTAVRVLYATALIASNKTLAEQQLRDILNRDPNNVGALNNLAWLLSERDPKQANGFAQRALKAAPNLASVQDTSGWIAWQLKQAPAAIALLERAHSQSPADPEIAYHLSMVMAASNRPGDAKNILNPILASKRPFEDRRRAEQLIAKLN